MKDYVDAAMRNGPIDVAGSLLSDPLVRDAIERIGRYNTATNFYAGRHHELVIEGGKKNPVINMPRKIVDKRASWASGRGGFRFMPQRGNETVTDVLDAVWRANRKPSLIRRTSKYALTCGDAFLYFSVNKMNSRGEPLPQEKWSIKIFPLNPAFVFPVWKEHDPSSMQAVLLQFPVTGKETGATQLFSAYIDEFEIVQYRDSELISKEQNPLGVIPLVHIANEPYGDLAFGISALQDVNPLIEKANALYRALDRIIQYHAEPTTLVYGTNLRQMERGAGRLWSNLPPPNEARVENLEMKGDLAASYRLFEETMKMVYVMGKTPKIVFDSEGLSVSNTSGVAMQLLFQPLVEATMELQDEWELAVIQGNKIIDRIYENIFGVSLAALSDSPESYLETSLKWFSLLPKDEQVEVDLVSKKLELGLISKAEASRLLSGVSDTERLALELAADKVAELAIESSKAAALAGRHPNFSAAMMNSIFLSEDLLDTATALGKLTPDEGEDRPDGSAGS